MSIKCNKCEHYRHKMTAWDSAAGKARKVKTVCLALRGEDDHPIAIKTREMRMNGGYCGSEAVLFRRRE